MAGVVAVAVSVGPKARSARSPGRRLVAGRWWCASPRTCSAGSGHPWSIDSRFGALVEFAVARIVARAEAERAGIDVDDVVDVVAHRVTPVPGKAGVLESVDDRYRAVFDGSGFALDDFRVSLTHGAARRHRGAAPVGAVARGRQRRLPADQRRE